jgi:drug/metabolite transporter (DMT)-like permease
MIWVLVFVSALAWAGFDVGRKRLVAQLTGAQALHLIMTVQLCLSLPLLGIGAVVDLPRSSPWSLVFPPLPGPPGWEYFGLLALVSLFNLAANLLFVRSVQLSPLSLTTPYLSFTPVFAALVSWLLFSERPSAMSATGIVIVASGAFVLNPGQNFKKDLLAPFKALLHERGSLLMVLVALLFSVMPIIDKKAVGSVTPLLHTSAAGLIMASIYGLWASRSEPFRS